MMKNAGLTRVALEPTGGRTTRLIVVAAALTGLMATAACSSAANPGTTATSKEANAYTTAQLFAREAGTIIFYENLRDQILDSDVVVIGRTVDVVSGGSEPGDESGPIEYIFNVVEVDEVISSSGFVAVRPGDRLQIVNFKPNNRSIEELRSAIDRTATGLFLLFNAANLKDRLDDTTAQGPIDVWLLQTAESVVFEGSEGERVAIDTLIRGMSNESFDELVSEVRSTAEELIAQGAKQPREVLGARFPAE